MILNTQVKQIMPVGYLKSVDKKALVALFKDRRSNDTKSFGDKTTKIIAAVRQFIDPDITDKGERWNEIQRVLANVTGLDEIAVAMSLATNEDGEDLSDGTKKNLLNVWGQWHFGNDPFSPAFNATLADLTELMNINSRRIKAGGGFSAAETLKDDRRKAAWLPKNRLEEAVQIWDEHIQRSPDNEKRNLKMVAALFSMQPALRAENYSKIHVQPQADAVSTKKNTMVRNDNDTYTITLRSYKTANQGDLVLELSEELSWLIDEHLAFTGNTEFLLENPKKSGSPIPSCAELIKTAFSVLTGNDYMTASLLRKIWVTYTYQETDQLSEMQKGEFRMNLAKKMGHAPATAERYYNWPRYLNP